ncbi:MAG: DUF1153 domain-containing protein [Rhodospirillales bacterium]|nr:MAG: DUF1153 domain-containing protein [Rhodospirillales bacterium]
MATTRHETAGTESDGLAVGAVTNPSDASSIPASLSFADLPPADTGRWVARRKAQVVAAVAGGLITLDEACRRYALSAEEFLSWQKGLADDGLAGLRLRSKRRP